MNIVSFGQAFLTEIIAGLVALVIALAVLWIGLRDRRESKDEISMVPRMLSDEELDSLEPDQRYRMVEGQ